MSRKTAIPRRSSGRFPKIAAIEPLPGLRQEGATGWVEALVMPREQPGPYRPSPTRCRSSVTEAGREENAQFRDDVLRFLEAHHLLGAVRWISEPGSLPMVSLHCTPRVLELLRRDPRFEAGLTMPLGICT